MTTQDAQWLIDVFKTSYYMTTLTSKTMFGYYEAERILKGNKEISVRGCSCEWRAVANGVNNLFNQQYPEIEKLYNGGTTEETNTQGEGQTQVSRGDIVSGTSTTEQQMVSNGEGDTLVSNGETETTTTEDTSIKRTTTKRGRKKRSV